MGEQSVDPEICPCCRYRTGCITCPVCFWTRSDPDAPGTGPVPDGPESPTAGVRDGQNSELTLAHAQLNFAIYGASHPRYQEMVRSPRPDEIP